MKLKKNMDYDFLQKINKKIDQCMRGKKYVK